MSTTNLPPCPVALVHRLSVIWKRCTRALSSCDTSGDLWMRNIQDGRYSTVEAEVLRLVPVLLEEAERGGAPSYSDSEVAAGYWLFRPRTVSPDGRTSDLPRRVRERVSVAVDEGLPGLSVALLFFLAERAGTFADCDTLSEKDLELYALRFAQDPGLAETSLRICEFALACNLAYEIEDSRYRRFVWPQVYQGHPELVAVSILLLMTNGPAAAIGGNWYEQAAYQPASVA